MHGYHELLQCLCQILPRRLQVLLRLRIIVIARRVNLVSAGTEKTGGEHVGYGREEAAGVVDYGWRGETELTGGRFCGAWYQQANAKQDYIATHQLRRLSSQPRSRLQSPDEKQRR